MSTPADVPAATTAAATTTSSSSTARPGQLRGDAVPQELVPAELALDEAPADHPFADPTHYDGDIALLNYLLQDLRVISRQLAAGTVTMADHDVTEWEVHGLKRRTVICDVEALVQPVLRNLVGFFGDRRADIADLDVDERELDVVAEFRSYPGIISYSSIELMGGQWANLVLHATPDDRRAWRHSQVHIVAAEALAPRMYHNVRIHNGRIVTGPIGSGTVIIESTKYWDYDVEPVWHAFRRLPGGIAESVEQPVADDSTALGDAG